MADKTIKKGTKSTRVSKAPSTGLKKSLSSSEKTYNPPVKGSGKPKYQNVTKENRINTKKRSVDITTYVKQNLAGKKVTKQEKRAIGNKVENVAKAIDREYKEQKGVRTPKSTTKVPVKSSGRGRGGGALGGFRGGADITDMMR